MYRMGRGVGEWVTANAKENRMKKQMPSVYYVEGTIRPKGMTGFLVINGNVLAHTAKEAIRKFRREYKHPRMSGNLLCTRVRTISIM